MNLFSSANTFGFYPDTADGFNPAKPGGIPAGWDFIIITSSNEAQALSFRKQIKFRLDKEFLPRESTYAVIPDIDNKRIGSGGAVFNVIKYIYENSVGEDRFSGKRILVINSGGDSKRVPQYSACGKIFSPVPRTLSKGISATLFDEIIKSVADLRLKIPAGMLILTGDILLSFDTLCIELDALDAAAFSVKENIETGKNHGVFIPDEQGNVKKFMHKSPLEDLEKHGAKDSDGNVHLDTGAIWFGVNVVNDLFELISYGGKVDDNKFKAFANEEARLSFYADFVYPMAREASLDSFYSEKPEGEHTKELRLCRKELWNVLHKYPMKLVDLSPAPFIHFGTTSEILKMITSDIEKYAHFGWKREVNTNAVTSGRFSSNGSFVDDNSEIGEGSYIENSSILNSKIGRNCIISNTSLDSVEIPDNIVVHCLKQNDEDFVVRIYGIQDNPKLGLDDGGTFLGISIRKFLINHKMEASDLWDSEPYNLWNAKLYFKSNSLRQSLLCALALCEESAKKWEITRRVSLKQSYESADIDYKFCRKEMGN